MNIPADSVFHKPNVPKNTWQMLSWLIFEPLLLEHYSNNLGRKRAIVTCLKAYCYITVIALMIYVLACFITVVLDAPTFFPTQYKSGFIKNYRLLAGFQQKILFVILDNTLFVLLRYWFVGIILGLISCIIYGLTMGIIVGPIIILSASASIGLAPGGAFGLVVGLMLTFMVGLTILIVGGLATILPKWFGATLGIIGILIIGVIIGLGIGLAEGLSTGLLRGINIALIYGGGFVFLGYIIYFRIYNYIFYLVKVFNYSFFSSPYHDDAVIWLPIWGAKKRFCLLAWHNPENGLCFVSFLRKYRPLQKELADHIAHSACAGHWLSKPLVFAVLEAPLIETKRLKPSDDWFNNLKALKEQLVAYRHQTELSSQISNFHYFQKQLNIFIGQTSLEDKSWRDGYLQVLRLWKKIALEEQESLEEKAQLNEPITRNVYLAGSVLNPGANDGVFMGRNDVKNNLASSIYNSPQMPLFLIQGQRRVGKTSLLKFLEVLLGSGFKVVYQDLQGAQSGTVQSWMIDLQQKIYLKLNIPVEISISASSNWLTTWDNFETALNSLHLHHHYKLILAFDEYEGLHQLLQKDPEQGARLLGAMRSFSQHQNKIVFLFVGAALFTELENPNWGNYFVQIQTLHVDYLESYDCKRLITEPVNLVYPDELIEQMINLTQGHPALLQLLCSEMVNLANKNLRRNMNQTDLDSVIQKVLADSSVAPMAVFWQQFCEHPACKATVRAIIRSQNISDKKQLHRLREHGFIVQDTAGLWQLRVPLFERWLTTFERLDLD